MNPAMIAALMQAGQGIGQLAGSLFSKWKNPADAAMPYMNQIGGNLNPWITAGQNELPNLQQQYGQMTNGQFINDMGKNFQQSPGFNFATQQATNAANRAAAAGGMVGSPQEQQNLAGNITGMANQDYYNWLSHAMNEYNAGISGEQGLAGMGLQAGGDMANALMSQANLGYAGAQNQNQRNAGIWSSIGSFL